MPISALKPASVHGTGRLDAAAMRAESDGAGTSLARLIFAAGEGDVAAQLVLGLRYLTGDGPARDPRHAVHWFRRAAERNEPRAQYWLARCHLTGDGVRQSHGRAYFWSRLACANGQADSGSIAAGAGQHLTPEERRWIEAQVRALSGRRGTR